MTNALETMKLSDYDYQVPEDLVAVEPATDRDASKLMVLHRAKDTLQHRSFKDLPDFLNAGDCIVLNRSRVLPARLVGRKATGGNAELLMLDEMGPGLWTALSAQLKPGVVVELLGGVTAAARGRAEDGSWLVRFSTREVRALLEKDGLPPLPPYIRSKRKRHGMSEARPEDMARYQTVYAQEQGSLAAPTAGLHFTPDVLQALRDKGVAVVEVVLHVGLGTFKPVTAEDVRDHKMLPERYEVSPEAVETLRANRAKGGRVVAVGTTATRTLETLAGGAALVGATSLYIVPGHRFRAIDALLTNFHQPASTPLLLTSAFAGREKVLSAYQEAIGARYRLFSYGDAMLIL